MAIEERDRHSIEDLLARWCWLMDGGKGAEWAGLWTNDGTFTGIPDTATGHEQLSTLPAQFYEIGDGKFRHTMSNVTLESGPENGEVIASAYSTLTNWADGGALIGFAKARYTLVKDGREWKIKALHAEAQA